VSPYQTVTEVYSENLLPYSEDSLPLGPNTTQGMIVIGAISGFVS